MYIFDGEYSNGEKVLLQHEDLKVLCKIALRECRVFVGDTMDQAHWGRRGSGIIADHHHRPVCFIWVTDMKCSITRYTDSHVAWTYRKGWKKVLKSVGLSDEG